MISSASEMQKRWMYFGIWTLACAALFAKPIYRLLNLALRDDTASHILLIPFISAWLLYSNRAAREPVSNSVRWPSAILLFLSGLSFWFAATCRFCTTRDSLSGYSLSLILAVIAGFVLVFGFSRAKDLAFALLFLLLAVPIPDAPLNKIIHILQIGSAQVALIFFDISGAPVLRDGLIFHLPTFSIEVAQECSGIRSSLALLILALLVAHFSFRPFWKKLLFVLVGLCMMLIKNGIRIAALTLLATYVDPGFLYGRLHRDGGIVFFLIGLALLWPFYLVLRSGETHSPVDAHS